MAIHACHIYSQDYSEQSFAQEQAFGYHLFFVDAKDRTLFIRICGAAEMLIVQIWDEI